MRFNYIEEPDLQFGSDTHPCPRAGITDYDVFDAQYEHRRDKIIVGAIGNQEGLDLLNAWLNRCSGFIPPKARSKQPELFPPFPGFCKDFGFKADFVFDSMLSKRIGKSDIDRVAGIKDESERIDAAVEIYFECVEYLAQNRNPDVIVCILPESLYGLIYKPDSAPVEEEIQEEEIEENPLEVNFRRAIKAKAMFLRVPLQLVWEDNLRESPSGRQDDATRAWNFCTALYYKASQSTPTTIPWRLPQKESRPSVCFVGVGFYKSRDKKVLNTSLAQIFDELGKSVILRGTPVEEREDRIPHLSEEQAHELLTRALKEYKVAVGHLPARLVMHKSSNYEKSELEGFQVAAGVSGISSVDFITIQDTNYRLFRKGSYPPLRGTWIELDRETHLLYTRGSVLYYRTYPGMYIPQPLEIRIVRSDESPRILCEEILELTKMNWNNTQFDGKYPITLRCARKVGEIMKYMKPEDRPEIGYRFYM